MKNAKKRYRVPNPKTENALSGYISLHAHLEQRDRSFPEMLFDLIDERGLTDVDCYKRAHVDKRIFHKVRSNEEYVPSKQTAVAFALALQLDLDTTQELLSTAGFILSRSLVWDRVIYYFILNENYNIFAINEVLDALGQTLLGSF